jgi:L-arabinonolactonase
MSVRIECIVECQNHLGESPIWDVEDGMLYWVDGTGPRVGNPSIWRLNPRTGKVDNWSTKQDIGAMVLRKDGGALLAMDDGFYFFDFDKGGEPELIMKIEDDQPRSRLNDGKVDRRGRLYAGGMDDKEELKICGLWRLDPDLTATKIDDGIICSNGPCWSPDDKTFYFADTFQEEMWAYDFDIETGTVSNKRLFATSKDLPGLYDGSTVDSEGCLWNAMVVGGELIRYTPDGEIERQIGMPVRNVTSVNWGGPDMDILYVTSMARVKHPAVHDRFAAEVKPQFQAGAVFAVHGLGIKGTPEPRFGG